MNTWHRDRDESLRWVTDDLAIGPSPGADAWRDLPGRSVRVALDLRTAEEGGGEILAVPDLHHRWFPIRDGHAPPVAELFEVSAWLAGELRTSRALISCREGRGRSALLACATLMQLGYSLWGAYQVVRRGQPHLVLSDDQVKALEGLSSVRGTI
jgi:hypothetical protein